MKVPMRHRRDGQGTGRQLNKIRNCSLATGTVRNDRRSTNESAAAIFLRSQIRQPGHFVISGTRLPGILCLQCAVRARLLRHVRPNVRARTSCSSVRTGRRLIFSNLQIHGLRASSCLCWNATVYRCRACGKGILHLEQEIVPTNKHNCTAASRRSRGSTCCSDCPNRKPAIQV